MNSGRIGKCHRKCCWSPYGVCGSKGSCACHNSRFLADERGQRLADLLAAADRKQHEMRHQDELNDGHTGDY